MTISREQLLVAVKTIAKESFNLGWIECVRAAEKLVETTPTLTMQQFIEASKQAIELSSPLAKKFEELTRKREG